MRGAARQVQPSPLAGRAASQPGPGERRTVVLSQLFTSRDRAALAALFTDEAASPDGISQTAYVTPRTNINKFPSLHSLSPRLAIVSPVSLGSLIFTPLPACSERSLGSAR